MSCPTKYGTSDTGRVRGNIPITYEQCAWIVRLLPSYGYALHWLAVWKLLDQVSTYLAFNYSELQLTELNLFINFLAEVTGLNAALVLIGPLQFGFLYIFSREIRQKQECRKIGWDQCDDTPN